MSDQHPLGVDVRQRLGWVRKPFPLSGYCRRCLRERDDLFWHPQDKTLYCADVFRCEARYVVQASREEHGRPLLKVADAALAPADEAKR